MKTLYRVNGPARPDNVCEHGSLRRQCVHCENAELDSRIERLESVIANIRSVCARPRERPENCTSIMAEMMLTAIGSECAAHQELRRVILRTVDAVLTPNAQVQPTAEPERSGGVAGRLEPVVGRQRTDG